MAKNDVRIRYTQKTIKESFYTLLREKPVEKITVRELCEKAEINRSTFYKHYHDFYDLLDKIDEEALDHFDAMLAGIEIKGLRTILMEVLRILKENAALFEVFQKHSGNHGFTHRLAGHCFHYMEQHMPSVPTQEFSQNKQGMGYAYLVGGAGAVIEFWLRGGCQEKPEEVADLIVGLTEKISS